MATIKTAEFKYPYVRFLNAYQGSIDFYVNGEKYENTLNFGDFSKYVKVNEGINELYAKSNSNGEQLSSITIDFDKNRVYTVAIVSIAGEPSLYGIYEPYERDNVSMGHLRICNLSPNLTKPDIYAGKYKILGDIDYLEISKYIPIIPDRYDFTVKEANSDKVLLNGGVQTIRPGIYNTMYLAGNYDNRPELTALISVDAASYDGMYL